MGRPLVAFLTSLVLLTPAYGLPESGPLNSNCPSFFNKLTATAARNQLKIAGEAVQKYVPQYLKQIVQGITYKETPYLTLYPILGPILVIDEGVSIFKNEGVRHLWKAPFRVAKKDGGFVTAALTLAYVDDKISITQIDYNQETKDFRSEIGKKVYVFADLIPEDDILAGVPKYDFDTSHKNTPNAYYVKAKDLAELTDKLIRLKKEHGEVFALSIYNHGFSGKIGDIDSPALRSLAPVEGLFEPNAKILLNSCYTAKGDKGLDFTKRIGMHFFDKGGTVYSSKVLITSNLVESAIAKTGLGSAPSSAIVHTFDAIGTYPHYLIYNALLLKLLNQPVLEDEPVRKTAIDARTK